MKETVIVGAQEQGWGWKDCGERFWKHCKCRREGGIVLCILFKGTAPTSIAWTSQKSEPGKKLTGSSGPEPSLRHNRRLLAPFRRLQK